ncbi:MAG: response regulator [Candidatus Riflebacteria bacterium]|nr:response regulator [Candidatus Riflebacteria bacterium]
MIDRKNPDRILVADDEMSIRVGCEKILTSLGFEVVTVENGLKALEAFEKKPTDIVFLDLMMPGLDGLSVIPELKKRDPDVVIVMITGYASFETAVKAIQTGAYDYVPKPFTPSELKIVTGRALEKRNLLKHTRNLQLERERSLKDLADEQSRTKTIVNAMGDPMMVVNRNLDLMLFNPAARFFLKDEVDPSGKPLNEVLILPSINEELNKIIQTFSEKPGITAVSTEISDPNRNKTFLMNAARINESQVEKPDSSLEDNNSHMRGIVLVFSDITPMKDLEKAKSRFVSVVAHELKAPVAAIEGYLDLVLNDFSPELEKYRQKIERCKNRAEMLQKLIRDLLDISRMEQGRIDRQLEGVFPLPVVLDTVEFLKADAEKRGISFDFSLPSEAENPFKVIADKGEITQIFTNLISNAIKYNRENGTVIIKSFTADGFWRISVADTGIGISEQNLKHLGEEFFRVKNAETIAISGTGLGMSIVNRLLELNHARLEIASTYGKGSTFTISWPLDNGK